MVNPFSFKTHPNCHRGHKYAEDVVAGKIISNIYIIGACNRYLRDLRDTSRFTFNADRAERYLRLVQKFEHVIGHWGTKNIVYEPWQCWVWMNIMGFISNATGYRRFRIAHVEVPRGNAKSAMASQSALYFGFLDEDPNGNQVATVATKKEQARIVLDSAMAMAKKNPGFLKRTGVRVLAHSIVQDRTNSKVRSLSSEHSGLDGLQDILAIMDELHAMRRETFDVVYSGMSKRKDSLTLCITTAGFDVESVGYSQSVYAKKLCLNEFEDDQFFAAVYCIDENDDIYDEANWIKANPNWDVSVDPVTFRAKAEKTKQSPSDLPNFKVKHLNMWISEANAFYDLAKWDACADPTITPEMFLNTKTRMGIDLASHIDITSIGYIFYAKRPGDDKFRYYLFDKSFIPSGTIKDERNSLYDDAVAKGFLIETQGDAINNDYIRDEATKLSKQFRVSECLYDTWNATEMAQKLSDKIEMVKFAMNTANFSEPMKKLDSLMREKLIVHNGSPVTRWCIGNVVAKRDHNDNVFPRKSHPKLKIDIAIALLMALAGWLQDDQKESVYEHRGVRFIAG
jgi:phage terminase large subunit-like protein